jgi:CubicO group peptidase (beta-lactamase class C family)
VKVFKAASEVLAQGVEARAFPAAVAEAGTTREVLWQHAIGSLSWEPASPTTELDTIFDLASLTKVLATTSLIIGFIKNSKLRLDDRILDRLGDWRGQDRRTVTIRQLLSHSGGLTAWLPLYRDHQGRPEFQRAISTLPLEYEPGTKSIYSDLGFMLLGFIVEDLGGRLADQFEDIGALCRSAPEELMFGVPADQRHRAAPTELDPWRGRMLRGEVHDENTWALGGAAGHAGLFGTASAVGAFARLVLRSLRGQGDELAPSELMRQVVTRVSIPGSSRALGWDTMLPTSSCGTRMSAAAFGHVGYTGTSLWIDPVRDRYVVLLTNRAGGGGTIDEMRTVRRAFHDALGEI